MLTDTMFLTTLLPEEASSQVHIQKARGHYGVGGPPQGIIFLVSMPDDLPKVFREAARVRPQKPQHPTRNVARTPW